MKSANETLQKAIYLRKQIILLVIAVVCFILFTIPFLGILRGVFRHNELEASTARSDQDLKQIEKNLDVSRAKILMGAGDSSAQEELRKKVEKLEAELALKEKENQAMREQVEMARTVIDLLKGKAAPASSSGGVEWYQKLLELFVKAAGAVASVVAGGKFVLDWLKRRRLGIAGEPASA